MKVLIINGSPREGGNTSIAVEELVKTFKEEGVETDVVCVGKLDVPGCKACRACREIGRCVQDDIVNVLSEKLKDSDGIIAASPVYFASPNATIKSVMDRLFFSCPYDLHMKVGASVAVARRAGTDTTFDVLNKYFTVAGMVVATSDYWNNVFGWETGDAVKDDEGLMNMRFLARNMTFLMKSIALGKEKYGLPEREPAVMTNFID